MSASVTSGATPEMSKGAQAGMPWLFSPAIDMAAFLGSALVSLAALAWGAKHGLLQGGDTPEWTWFSMILLVDVAHVYATGFRVYFDREELLRRPLLYFGTPLACFVLAAAIYSERDLMFWRCMAYLAVFHFVRQQYGWVTLYRAKGQDKTVGTKWIDTIAIYMATVYPLIYWHTALPRRFSWFVDQDFVGLPGWAEPAARAAYFASIAAYGVRATWAWSKGWANPGKDIVYATTLVCWYVGIIAFNSDYAFTVTNVVIHGVPYMVLVWWYMLKRSRSAETGAETETETETGAGRLSPTSDALLKGSSAVSAWRAVVILIATVWLLAYIEELFWNRAFWHEHAWLFGGPLDTEGWAKLLVPLLAVPQLTHYVLDGFIWKRRQNPQLKPLVSTNTAASVNATPSATNSASTSSSTQSL